MNYDSIINIIVEEICKKIDDIEINKKPKAVLMWSTDQNDVDILKKDFDVYNFDERPEDCDLVVLSSLCLRGLFNLAHGNSESKEERFVLKMLMMGKKIFIIEDNIEYRKYKNTAPTMLYDTYIKYEDIIKGFGVNIVKNLSDTKLERSINKNNKTNQNKCINENNCKKEIEASFEYREKIDFSNEKLISEELFKKNQIRDLKEVIVNKKSLITPLANDFIKINNLKLTKI